MYTQQHSDSELFRILLYRDNASELLAETTVEGLRLPSIFIPRHTRIAEEITLAIRNLWNLKSCCLISLTNGNAPQESFTYYVAELCERCDILPAGMQWRPVASFSDTTYQDRRDLMAMQDSLRTLEEYSSGARAGTFGKPGWLRTVTGWIESQGTGLSLTGEFRQCNASPAFSLIRFETDGPALWFKAVGQPNVHEYAITRKLTELIPRFLPHLVAANPAWNAWLSLEAAGAHLDAVATLEEWTAVATALADLQIASVGNGLHLIEAGCRDVRLCSLPELVVPFFDCMTELMERQTKSAPASLTRIEIESLARNVRSALDDLGTSEIPSALGHLDFNLGNILVSGRQCTFLDWAEGYVGHPFFTFQYLLEQWRRFHGTNPTCEKSLVSAYTIPWQAFTSPVNIVADFQLVPLLAAFAYGASCSAWKNPEALRQPILAGYLRSLARRMKREADELRERRFTCVR